MDSSCLNALNLSRKPIWVTSGSLRDVHAGLRGPSKINRSFRRMFLTCSTFPSSIRLLHSRTFNMKLRLGPRLERFVLKNYPSLQKLWRNIIVSRGCYYKMLKAKIDWICIDIKLGCKFCCQSQFLEDCPC